MKTPRLWIGGQWLETQATSDVVNPATREVITRAPLGDIQTLETALTAALNAFPNVRGQAAHQRSTVLRAIAQGIEQRRPEFVDTIIAEAGKPITFAEAEVARAIMTFTAAAEESRRQHGEVLDLDAFPSGQGHVGFTRRFPLGVIYGITPFNFPLNLVAHKVAPCIATGNTMVLKPALKTPLTALLLAEVLEQAGVPPGQINVVTCPNEIAGHLVGDSRVKMISFTGSPAVGWQLKQKCGKQRITLELGGNAGVVVHEDADLATAIPLIATSGFGYAGQSCISAQRIFVHAPVYQTFRDQFVAHVRAHIRSGDPRERETVVGPLIDPGAVKRVRHWIDDAVGAGANLLLGGKAHEQVVEPTILEKVDPAQDVYANEVFAPVVTLHSYEHFEEALARVNDSPFGLQAGVFTKDLQRAMQAFASLDVGGVLINNVPSFRVENMPYGGIKESGFGREGVRYAMEEMTEVKSLILNPGQ
jgi:acyl-CoA reductase-like NAD-dependent aldehyde dehydrogenase